MRAFAVFLIAALLTPAQAADVPAAPGVALPDAKAPAEPSAPKVPSAGSPAGKTDPASPLKDAAAPTRGERLDALFKELKREASPEKAAAIAARIGSAWNESGSATVDLLMLRAGEAMAKSNSAAAFDMLDQAILLDPGYAEAWNRRATLNYTTSAYGKSLADIEQTLRLEPRHFGALMGLGMILEETERKQKALDTYLRVLAIYPTMKAAQDGVARLADELTGQGI